MFNALWHLVLTFSVLWYDNCIHWDTRWASPLLMKISPRPALFTPSPSSFHTGSQIRNTKCHYWANPLVIEHRCQNLQTLLSPSVLLIEQHYLMSLRNGTTIQPYFIVILGLLSVVDVFVWVMYILLPASVYALFLYVKYCIYCSIYMRAKASWNPNLVGSDRHIGAVIPVNLKAVILRHWRIILSF